MFNVRSVANKIFDIFVDVLANDKPHLILITETWLFHDNIFTEPTVFKYKLLRCNRTARGVSTC